MANDSLMKTFCTLMLLFELFLSRPAGALEEKQFHLGGSTVRVNIVGEGRAQPREIFAWVESTSRSIENYFGRFPVDELEIQIRIGDGDSMHGRTWGYSHPRIGVRLGRDLTLAEIQEHWILTHEMCHLAFPNVQGHRWLEEGMATYVEPLVQARAGTLSATKFWDDMKWGLPHGQSQRGDRGLAYDRGWGRTYWGGALFWFVVDLELRRTTHNRVTIRDVLKHILSKGGNIEVEWTLEKVLTTGDEVAETPVVGEVADRLVFNPGRIELPEIWSKLGVAAGGNSRSAPWGHIRDGIFSAD
ncbi:MAG: hypothetical protein KC800_14825 [Candidatus Eremiobacteraeota bacterium]|nr:hypothetical protein [Candidatus Eremiobacteraeota bacterium]